MVGSTLLPGRVLFPTVLSDGSPHSRRQGPHIQEHTTNALEEVHRTAPEFPLCGSFPSRTLSYQPASLVSQRSVPLSHFTHLSEFPFPVQWQEAGGNAAPYIRPPFLRHHSSIVAFTLVYQKPVDITQEKIWNFLLHLVWDQKFSSVPPQETYYPPDRSCLLDTRIPDSS